MNTEVIKSGFNQQLEQMEPEDRMGKLAGIEFARWTVKEFANKTMDKRTTMYMKTAYIGGFMRGLDRAMQAIYQQPTWQDKVVKNVGWWIIGVAMGASFMAVVNG